LTKEGSISFSKEEREDGEGSAVILTRRRVVQKIGKRERKHGVAVPYRTKTKPEARRREGEARYHFDR